MFNESQQSIIDSITAISKQRDEAQAQAMALREAVGALLEAMPFDMSVCLKCHSHVLATKVCRFEPPIAGSWFACDEHATPGAMDMRTAPHVRRLRALLSAAAAPPCPACGRHDAPRGQRCAFCAQLGDDLPAG